MKKHTPKSELDLILRKKSEELLNNKIASKNTNLSESEIVELINELDVLKNELERQSQALKKANDGATISENKKNKKLIKLSEEKYQTLFENDRDSIGIFRISDDGKIGNFIEVNDASSEIFGYSKTEFLSLSVLNLEKVSKKTVNERLKNLKLHGKIEIQTTIQTKSGEYKDVEVLVVLINYLNEPAVMNVTRDITERKQLENNIKKAYENLENILDAIPDLLFEIGHDGMIYHFHSHNDDLLTASPEEILGKLFQDVLPADAANVVMEALEEANEKGWSIGKIYSLELPKGKFWFELSVSPINDAKNKDKHFIALSRNINGRKETEEALKESEYKLQSIFNLANSGIVMTDLNGNILIYNNWWKEKLGYTDEEMMGINNLKVTYPDDIEFSNNWFNQILEGKIQKCQFEKRYVKKDKSVFWGEVSISAIKDENNKVIKSIGIITDITERKKSQEALLESEKFLKQTEIIAKLGSFTLDIETGNWKSSEVLNSIFGIDSNVEKSVENWISIIHPEWRETMMDYYVNEVIGKKEDFHKEYKIVRQNDKEERWVYGNGELVFNEKQEPIKLIGTIQDITERKNAEFEIIKSKEEAEKSSKYLDKIINNVGVPVFVKDDQSRIVIANDAFCKMFGLILHDIIGKTLAEDVSESELKSFLKIDKQVLEDGQENINEEVLTIRENKPLKISTRKTRFIDVNGNKFLVGVIHDITKQKENENILEESEKFLKQTQLIAQLGTYTFEIQSGQWKGSEVLDSIFGIDANYERSIRGWTPIIHPEWREPITDYFFNQVFANKSMFDFEFKIIRQNDHSERWVHGLGELQLDDKDLPIKMIGSVQDITERKEKFEELEKLNRAYSLNSQINDLILRTNNQEALFQEVCEIAVNCGKFRMSFIGLFDEVENAVVPKVWYGFEDGYLKQIKNFPIKEASQAKGPTAKALFYDKSSICNDIATDPIMEPWREEALKRGYRSMIALPIKIHNKTIGTFNLYSDQINFFKSKEEIELLEKISKNIAFSLQTSLAEEERKNAEKRFRDIVDSTSGIVWESDARTSKYSYVSKQAERLTGFTLKEWQVPGFWENRLHPNDKEKTIKYCNSQTEKMLSYDITYRFITKKNKIIWLKGLTNVVQENGKPRWLRGVMFDITEQKQTEELLNESEEKYRGLVENSSNAIVIYVKGKIVFVNNECVNLIGSTDKNQLIGKSILQYVHPDNRARVFRTLKEIAIDGVSLPTSEEKFLRMDGEIIDVEIKAIPTLYKHKLAVQLLIQDITKRKKSEEKIRQLSQAVEQSPSTIVITDLIGNIQYVNSKFEETTGYSFEEVQGKNPRILNSGHTKNEEYKDMWKTIVAGNDWHGEFYNKRKDGSFYWEFASISPIINEKGEISQFIAIKEDITSRKEIELEKQILTERLTEAQTLAKIGSFETDLITFNEIWSLEIYRIFELDPETYKATYSSYLNIIHPDDREKFDVVFKDSLNKNTFNSLEYRIITVSGKIKYIEANWHINYDEQGKPLRALGTCQDISHSKLIEVELIKAKEQAEESDRLKSAFLANMSHEIRTPMNGILGFTKLLKEPQLSGENQQEYIKIIEKSGYRMLNIINDIISISKVESGQMEINPTDTNVNEQIKYLYTFFKHEANQKGIVLSYSNTLSKEETNIKTDREKLYAILTNLVKNAIKFTDSGSIEFGYSKKGDFLEFYVKDTGTGVAEDQKTMIFERFRQAHESLTRNFGGSGLGLTISKAYIELLGGNIWLESKEGEGSTFYFTIPYIHTKNKVKKEESFTTSEKTNAPIRKLKVLIVEDDAISKLLITLAFKKIADEILHASTGIEAIEACRNNPDIDVVMMDVNMPEMDGYEATKQIRKFNENLVIIAQTANGMQSDYNNAIAAGLTDYISKPINISELNNLIYKYFKE